jgi:non-ribosomal peptide synthetase component E (peptide arylation enzyme)
LERLEQSKRLERDERSEEEGVLDGVVRFPPEFAARYRAKGYWEDRSLRTFSPTLFQYADRVAIIDREQPLPMPTYERSDVAGATF